MFKTLFDYTVAIVATLIFIGQLLIIRGQIEDIETRLHQNELNTAGVAGSLLMLKQDYYRTRQP